MKWTLKPTPEQQSIKHLQESLNIPPLIAHLLVQRGISTYEDARKYFRPEFSDLHSPWLMKDMTLATNRVLKAITAKENIMIFGDYDVDGTTSVALVYDYLKDKTPQLFPYIPDRYKEGYGLSFEGIDKAAEQGCTLIIALDCGIKSIDKVAYAKGKNIDFIICDHHLPGEELPEAVAVLNPKQADCAYPYKELCGCGIGFKLIQALQEKLGAPSEDLVVYLDLVATAIGADIVSMTGENRVLAKLGMQVINTNPRIGISTLLKNRKKKTFTISDVVFFVAPRINAAGRIDHGKQAVKLLTATNETLAEQIAAEIELLNTERKSLDQSATAQALEQIINNGDQHKKATVVFDERWHKGVVGIVASRLIETHYRPTVVFTKSGDVLAASARSIKGFDLYQALENCSEHLIQFGGHLFAAGMTCHAEQYNAFKAAFEAYAEQHLEDSQLSPSIEVDAELNLIELDHKLLRLINQMEPFGPDNLSPVFVTQQVFDTGYGKTMGNEEHLRLYVKSAQSEPFAAIGFGLGKHYPITQNRQPFSLVFSVEENEWNGQVSIQLRMRDLKG